MRVGLLSFPNSYSHGAALQMYALYRTVEELGYNPEIINYCNPYMKNRLFDNDRKSPLKRKAKNLAAKMIHLRRERGFRSFEKRMKFYPAATVGQSAQLKAISNRYDKMICGSDQVWNPDITGCDLNYFFAFCADNDKKVSYAPSFGVEQLSPEYAEKVAAELRKFYRLSVRECQGYHLIQQISGLAPEIVLDPTLLHTAEQWYADETEVSQAKGDYIFYYTILDSPTLKRFCGELSEKTGYRILAYGSNTLKKLMGKDPECICDILPQEWLYLIHHAKYVVTNSFHGTAFSINMRKNFYVEYSSRTNSRLENIIDLCRLQNRVTGRTTTDDFRHNIDYSAAEAVLSREREKSMDYLRGALGVDCNIPAEDAEAVL